jgi:heme O synthase-like polyprenyltransferase
MATHPFIIFTFALVFAFFGYFFFTFLMDLISGIFVVIGCLALAYTICTLAFKRESALDRRFLLKLFSKEEKAS